MTLATVLKYLLGHRQAILEVAASRWSVWIGLLFVMAAGVAREYDGEDLLHEPWHLLLPLGASLVTSAVLYVLLRVLLMIRAGTSLPELSYRTLLSLYWMTAPLALLYGIPVERFLSAADATRANLTLLGVVSLWRVLLISRALAVVYQVGLLRASFPVMLFADTVAVILIWLTPLPVISVMGGIRLSESEAVLLGIAWTIGVLGVLSWPIWLIGAVIACNQSWRVVANDEIQPRNVAPHLWIAAALAIAVWGLVLPITQREQQLRRQVESDLRGVRIREALLVMSAHERSDFPPHWDPPPRVAYRETLPDITEIQESLDVISVSPWVRQIYREKFGNWLLGDSEYGGVWLSLSPQEADRRLAVIERMPDRISFVRNYLLDLDMALRSWPPPLRARAEKLLREAGIEIEQDQDESNPSVQESPDPRSDHSACSTCSSLGGGGGGELC